MISYDIEKRKDINNLSYILLCIKKRKEFFINLDKKKYISMAELYK